MSAGKSSRAGIEMDSMTREKVTGAREYGGSEVNMEFLLDQV
jgi:hypothetical protein